jgi:hypothetical protein
MPRPGAIAPMSLLTYDEVRPWGKGDQGEGFGPSDAAVVYRSTRRYPHVQRRSIAQRRADCRHRQVTSEITVVVKGSATSVS